MDEIDDLLLVLQDAKLDGDTAAVKKLGAEVASRLGVTEVGVDEFGVWLTFDIDPDAAAALGPDRPEPDEAT